MAHHPPPIILLLGPTAGGKTDVAIELAVELAQQLPHLRDDAADATDSLGGECICCDSMQIYRGMDIGTAKPTAQQRARVPHHLVDIADPATDDFSVDHWLRLANQAIDAITARGRLPIIVGGTNLYIQALLEGMFDGPAADPKLRATLADLTGEQMHAELQRIDPEAAARIHRNDRKRMIRAIEVFHATGQPISTQQGQWADAKRRENVFIVGLKYPAEAINRRINARVKQMIAEGLIDEVQRLHEADALGPLARQALGYRQILDAIEGRMTIEDAIEQIKIRTRRYAKQQRTWLRRFQMYADGCWIDAADRSAQDVASEALTAISPWLATCAAAMRNASDRPSSAAGGS